MARDPCRADAAASLRQRKDAPPLAAAHTAFWEITMPESELERLSLYEIMSRWPGTVRVFVDRGFHCVGCPVASFNRLADAAREHRHDLGELRRAVATAIATDEASPVGPARPRRQSAADGAGP
jgi:hybrid cluster-associated redox disulfide protein